MQAQAQNSSFFLSVGSTQFTAKNAAASPTPQSCIGGAVLAEIVRRWRLGGIGKGWFRSSRRCR